MAEAYLTSEVNFTQSSETGNIKHFLQFAYGLTLNEARVHKVIQQTKNRNSTVPVMALPNFSLQWTLDNNNAWELYLYTNSNADTSPVLTWTTYNENENESENKTFGVMRIDDLKLFVKKRSLFARIIHGKIKKTYLGDWILQYDSKKEGVIFILPTVEFRRFVSKSGCIVLQNRVANILQWMEAKQRLEIYF